MKHRSGNPITYIHTNVAYVDRELTIYKCVPAGGLGAPTKLEEGPKPLRLFEQVLDSLRHTSILSTDHVSTVQYALQ
jgi:hypothetical protein